MPRVVIAIGGNSLIPDAEHKSGQDIPLWDGKTAERIVDILRTL